MTKMTPEQKAFRKLKRGTKSFWMTEALKIRHHRLTLKWIREGAPALTEYADKFYKGVAFVMGTGPSLARVKIEQWNRLAKFWSVGVNRVPWWLQKERQITNIPALGLCVDHTRKGDYRAEHFDDPFDRMDGKRLVAMDADGLPHDWATPHFNGEPVLDLNMGIFLTVQATDPRWSRCTVGAIWLCYLLGFNAIFLLGVDHGMSYQNNKYETEMANKFYGMMRSHLEEKGVRLANVGTMSSVESLETMRLDEVLSQAERELSP